MRPTHRFAAAAAGCLLTLGVAGPAASVNLLANGEFNFDTQPWWAAPSMEIDWATLDHSACGDLSGSALARLVAPLAGFSGVVIACVDGVLGGEDYSFGSDLRFPTGQDGFGSAAMDLLWYDGPDCTGDLLRSDGSLPAVTTATPGVWIRTSLEQTIAPAGAVTAQLRVRLYKEDAGGQMEVRFDGVYLDTRPGRIFVDGLELESTCRWSAEVP